MKLACCKFVDVVTFFFWLFRVKMDAEKATVALKEVKIGYFFKENIISTLHFVYMCRVKWGLKFIAAYSCVQPIILSQTEDRELL